MVNNQKTTWGDDAEEDDETEEVDGAEEAKAEQALHALHGRQLVFPFLYDDGEPTTAVVVPPSVVFAIEQSVFSDACKAVYLPGSGKRSSKAPFDRPKKVTTRRVVVLPDRLRITNQIHGVTCTIEVPLVRKSATAPNQGVAFDIIGRQLDALVESKPDEILELELVPVEGQSPDGRLLFSSGNLNLNFGVEHVALEPYPSVPNVSAITGSPAATAELARAISYVREFSRADRLQPMYQVLVIENGQARGGQPEVVVAYENSAFKETNLRVSKQQSSALASALRRLWKFSSTFVRDGPACAFVGGKLVCSFVEPPQIFPGVEHAFATPSDLSFEINLPRLVKSISGISIIADKKSVARLRFSSGLGGECALNISLANHRGTASGESPAVRVEPDNQQSYGADTVIYECFLKFSTLEKIVFASTADFVTLRTMSNAVAISSSAGTSLTKAYLPHTSAQQA